MSQALLVVVGLAAGVFSGLFGIGGGIIIVPILVCLFHYSQQAAQGTSLAMLLPPIGLLAVLRYWKSGYIQVGPAVILAVAFTFGALLGANVAVGLSPQLMKRLFGALLIATGGFMVLKP